METDEEAISVCSSSKRHISLVEKFCVDSSLHGLKYIGQQRRFHLEKALWLASFLLSGVVGVVTIFSLWDKFWDSPVVTVFQPQETPADLIPFPAVTICNVNRVRRSTVKQLIERASDNGVPLSEKLKAYSDLYDLNHICETATTFAQRFNVSEERSYVDEKLLEDIVRVRKLLLPTSSDPSRVLREAAQNCSDLILLCLWLDEVQDCSHLFHGVETDFGFCCTFNVIPLSILLKHRRSSDSGDGDQQDSDVVQQWEALLQGNGYNFLGSVIGKGAKRNRSLEKFPLRQVFHGRSSGLTLLLDPDFEEYFCSNTDGEGFVIGAGYPLDFPRVRDHGIAVRPNTETFMSIKPTLTVADPDIYMFPTHKRECYISEELKLRYFNYYTATNCVEECISNRTWERCACVQHYMPRSEELHICTPDQFPCTERARKELIHEGLLTACHICLPTCNNINYEIEITFINMPAGVFNAHLPPDFIKPLNGRRSMAIVHAYMGVESTYPRLRKELYSIIDLISATGGLLSLCLGFSILSLLEICYFSTIRVCMHHFRRERMRTTPLLITTTNDASARLFQNGKHQHWTKTSEGFETTFLQ